MITRAYKVFTSTLCPPIQGGPPVWDGTLPHTLPRVTVDQSANDCAPGWNACVDLHTALRIAGLWPDGWPSRAFAVETDDEVLTRGDKLRAATWTITRELPEPEILGAIFELSKPFGQWQAEMAEQQVMW